MPLLARLSVALRSDGLKTACKRLPSAFPSLQELSVMIEDASVAVTVLQNISPSKLTRMRLRTGAWIHASTLRQLFSSLSQSSSQLASLSVEVCISGIGWQGTSAKLPFSDIGCITLDTLEPLLPLNNIFHLSIGHSDDEDEHGAVTVAIQLDDNAVETMANAWPHLQELYLASLGRPAHLPRPRATLRALLSLRVKCPHLHRAALDIADSIPDMEAFLEKVASLVDEHPLTKLTLGTYAQEDFVQSPTSVAKTLTRIFPLLKHMDIHSECLPLEDLYNHYDWETWTEVVEDVDHWFDSDFDDDVNASDAIGWSPGD